MQKKKNYDKFVLIRVNKNIKDILLELKEKTKMGYSEIFRRVFLYFDSHFITLLRILEEINQNDKKK